MAPYGILAMTVFGCMFASLTEWPGQMAQVSGSLKHADRVAQSHLIACLPVLACLCQLQLGCTKELRRSADSSI